MLALLAAVGALLLGPLFLAAAGASNPLRGGLDGFALTVVTGLCLLHLGPHAIEEGGWPAGLAIVVGDAVVADERAGHRDDLAGVGRVGEDFLIAGEGGVEAGFAFDAAGRGVAKRGAVENAAVLEGEACGGLAVGYLGSLLQRSGIDHHTQ